jgi:pyruvate kinase
MLLHHALGCLRGTTLTSMSKTAARRANASDAGVDTVAATLRGLCDEIRRAARDNRPGEGDEPTIAFAVAHADMVGLSFVSTRDDVRVVANALARNGGAQLGLILKIETRAGFDALPDLLTEALLRDAPCGVMIARGDLAIEVGWERLAEVQEEILWLCEAAHVPVIWATQVLDTLAHTGIASRAEITDAASGARAECVMLNKGPMIVAAIATLDDILARMATHRHKKTSLLRRLRAWSPESR